MGDPMRALQAREMIRVIKEQDLLSLVSRIGDKVYTGLLDLAKRYPGTISSLRGQDSGTFIAFDCEDAGARDRFVVEMRKRGVNMGGCGERAVRLRPMLVFGDKHSDILLETAEDVLKSMR